MLSNGWTSQTLSWLGVFHIFSRTFLAALISAMSSIMSSCRLNWLPLVPPEVLGGRGMDDVESRRFASTLVACILLAGNAAMDSRRPRPNKMEGGGALEIVTTE